MGREMRRVPKDWVHPKNGRGDYQPMHDETFATAAQRWKDEYAAWERGERPDYCTLPADSDVQYWEYNGGPPQREYYRPEWPEESRTHFQMYETCTEGTPISPVFCAIEPLARWLADNGASAFGSMTATYEQWLATCKRGWAPSAVASSQTGMQSGVAALAD